MIDMIEDQTPAASCIRMDGMDLAHLGVRKKGGLGRWVPWKKQKRQKTGTSTSKTKADPQQFS